MIIVGLDPEYTRAGICAYCKGKVLVGDVKTPPNPDKSYEQIFKDVYAQSSRIVAKINKMVEELSFDRFEEAADTHIFSECPPPQGQFSSGLYGLDIPTHIGLVDEGYEVYRIYPTFCDHVIGHKKSTKTEHVEVANYILSFFDWELLDGKKLNHDQADAVIFMARGLAKFGLLPKEVLEKYPNLNNEKEKALL